MKKRNYFAKKNESSFLNLVKVITENIDDETEGLDFDDEDADFGEEETDDMSEEDFADDDMSTEDGETVTLSIPRSLAMELMDALQSVIDGGEEEIGEEDFADEDMGDEEDFDTADDMEGDEFADDEMGDEDEEMEDEAAEDEDIVEEDEEVFGSNQSNVAQSTISRDGAPKRSKASTTWNTGKTVKSVFDQTASGEGEPAGVSRDGAPKRSKFSKAWSNSKTVSSRIQPGKHAFEIGK